MPISSKIIDKIDDFIPLKEEWNKLVESSELNYAYMTHQWFERWILDFNRSNNLAIITVRDNSELVAAAPLRIEPDRFKGLPVKVLGFMYSTISPRCNFILKDPQYACPLFDFIINQTNGWDIILARGMENNLQTTTMFLDYLKENYSGKCITEPDRIAAYVDLDMDWETYYNSLSKSYRRNITQSEHRLEKEGTFIVEKYDDYAALEPIFDKIVEVSRRSWKADVGTDLASREDIRNFYKNFSRIGSDGKLWNLYALKLNDKYIAFEYYLQNQHSLIAIRTDFDRDYEWYNPGYTVKTAIIKDLINRDGLWQFDLGGGFAAYKSGWCNSSRHHINVWLGSEKIYGKLLMKGKRFLAGKDQSANLI